MGIENNFGFKPTEKQNFKTGSERREDKLNRREFLKGMAKLAGVAVGGSTLIKGVELIVNKFADKEDKEASQEAAEEIREEPTEEQAEIEAADSISSREVLDFNKKGPIEFNLKTAEAIKNNWKEKYRNNPKLKNSLINAYRDIGYWRPYLEKIFEARGVPKELIYLAIPESHWQPNAVSKAGAAGPYQFMPKTARMYDLKVSADYDERKDPLLSARASRDLLADLFKASQDWSTALSGYNGGFIWEYLKRAKVEELDISYEGFLKFIENKLNLVKTEVKNMNHLIRTVERGENLNDIAEEYGLKPIELASFNRIRNLRSLRAGQKITVPISPAKREAIYNKKISGFSENLNYPAKYYAIMELIKEGFIKEQAKPIIFEPKDIVQPKLRYNFYTAKAGDKNLFRISKKFNISYQELARFNPRAVKNLRTGLEIKIPNAKSQPITLADVARQTNKPLARLEFLNPAIKKNAAIATNKIRV